MGWNPPCTLNRKIKIVQNRRSTDTKADDEDDNEEIPGTIGKPTYDTSERNGMYIPIRLNTEDDAIQIHYDGEISGKTIEPIIRRSNRSVTKPNRYGSVPYTRDSTEAGSLHSKRPGLDTTRTTIYICIKDPLRLNKESREEKRMGNVILFIRHIWPLPSFSSLTLEDYTNC